ncbi:MAG: DNA methyltransferase [Promethearchaeota archaeon]
MTNNKKQTKIPIGDKRRLNDLEGKEWIKRTRSWFIINPRPRTKGELNHPGKFPEEVVEHFVEFFTKKSDTVLDPMVGVGSTLLACRKLQRNAIGIDISEKFIQVSQERLDSLPMSEEHIQHVIVGDSLELESLLISQYENEIPPIDFVITSPPYWNMLCKSRGGSDSQHKERKRKGLQLTYSDDPQDIGNIQSYEEYLQALYRLFKQVRSVLKEDGYLVVIAQNMRDVDGTMRPIAWDLAKKLSKIFLLRQEQIWCQDNKKLGIWGYPTTYVSNVHHHYCLIFQHCPR